MSKSMMMGILAAVALAVPGVRAADEEAALSASVDVSVLSAYVWRGQVLNDEAVLQPSMTIAKGGLTLNYWGNMNLTDEITGDAAEFSEHDLLASYEFACPYTGAGITLGVVNYDFPNQAVDGASFDALVKNTAEAFATVGFDDVLLAPTLSIYYDFIEVDSFYGSLGISHSLSLIEDKLSLDGAFSAGFGTADYNTFYFGVDDDLLNDGNVSLSLPYAVTESLKIVPAIQYTWLWDSDIDDAAEVLYKDNDQVIGSVKASYAF